jgi:hypothetical protein
VEALAPEQRAVQIAAGAQGAKRVFSAPLKHARSVLPPKAHVTATITPQLCPI